MNLKLAVQATLLGGLVIFVWGAASHLLLPEPITVMSDTKSVDEFVAKHAPFNGAFVDPRGVMVIVGFLPGKTDKSLDMGPQLAIEFATNLLQAFLLLVVLLRLKANSVLNYGVLSGILGLMAWVSIEVSYGNWYSFPLSLLVIGFLDATLGFFLAGAVIGWLIQKQE